jgi:hypothetical protein
MSLTLTVQQRAARCRCSRYLAWWSSVWATCCKCMRAPEDCPCEQTDLPAVECLGVDFEHIRQPEGEDLACE